MRGRRCQRLESVLRGTILIAALASALAAIGGSGMLAGADAERPVLYVAAGGDDHGPCSRSRPCGSVRAAYAAATAGDRILLAAGRYPRQELPRLPRGRGVVVAPVPRARVELAGIDIRASRVELRDVVTAGWYVHPGSEDVVLRRVRSRGAAFITSASRIRVVGGSIGEVQDKNGTQVKAAAGSTIPPRDITFEGVLFHDIVRTRPGPHVDCLHVFAVDGLVLRGNRFRNCEAFNVLFTRFGDAGSPRRILIENNFFSCCRSGFYSVSFSGSHDERWQDVMVRYNSADKAFNVGEGSTSEGANVRFVANVAPAPPGAVCHRPGTAFRHNLWTEGRRCSPSDRVARPRFRDARGLDFHLRRSSPALGRGDPRNYPRLDIDGDRRPAGRRPDAGADEFVASRP